MRFYARDLKRYKFKLICLFYSLLCLFLVEILVNNMNFKIIKLLGLVIFYSLSSTSLSAFYAGQGVENLQIDTCAGLNFRDQHVGTMSIDSMSPSLLPGTRNVPLNCEGDNFLLEFTGSAEPFTFMIKNPQSLVVDSHDFFWISTNLRCR